ncbi:hypothetical protein [Kitasatospora sp. MBT66]|uniref:hypothetical protein n=1 Tax=Kitasatospora sp. MBT66 TaxID=1444769 RepID=UPI0005BA5842|nr:hypothetical protein [Kitasatospora sp. MBT66]
MGVAGQLSRPDLPPGAHRTLNEALHQLHSYARYPSVGSIATDMKKSSKSVPAPHRAPVPSRTTIYNLFCSTRRQNWDFTHDVAVHLAGRVRWVTPEQVHSVSIIIDRLCRLAREETGPRTDPQPADTTPASDGSAMTVFVPAQPRARTRTPLALPEAKDALHWWTDELSLPREQDLEPAFVKAVSSNRELLSMALRAVGATIEPQS